MPYVLCLDIQIIVLCNGRVVSLVHWLRCVLRLYLLVVMIVPKSTLIFSLYILITCSLTPPISLDRLPDP